MKRFISPIAYVARSALAVAMLVISPSAYSHHSSSIYDMTRTVTVDGVVSRITWANPHVYLYVEEITDANEIVEWEVEVYPPAAMRRIGWTADTLTQGDSIKVSGNPTTSENRKGMFPSVIESHDQTLFHQQSMIQRLSEASTDAEVGAISLEGTWETLASLDLILRFYNPDIELTEDGQAAFESYEESTMLPALNCIPYSAPLLMIDPDFKHILIGDETIEIHGGFSVAERTVYMKLQSHEGAVPTVQGHSIGRWEGQSLVIDTTRFSDHRIGSGYRGVPSGSQKHLVERLTLRPDGKRLTYRFELSDPEYLAEPITGSVEWAYRPNFEFVREPCDIESARRFIED